MYLDNDLTPLRHLQGLGLAVVARIVEQLGGQLRVDSEVNFGSRFSFLIPLALSAEGLEAAPSAESSGSFVDSQAGSPPTSALPSREREIDGLVVMLDASHISPCVLPQRDAALLPVDTAPRSPRLVAGASPSITTDGRGTLEVKDPVVPICPIKADYKVPQASQTPAFAAEVTPEQASAPAAKARPHHKDTQGTKAEKLRILIVEVG
jgi:hypothetical protein